MDRILCRCDNNECGLELTIFPHGIGGCPRCGKGRLRPTQPIHSLAYSPPPPVQTQRIFSETFIMKYFEEGMKQLEERLAAEIEMDKYGSKES